MAQDDKDKSKVNDPEGQLVNSLTNDQLTLLSQALELVKQQVFTDVTRRLRNYLIAATTIVTLFGLVSVVGLKTAVKDATVGALREDAALRQSIKDDASAKVTEAQSLIKQLEAILAAAKSDRIGEGESTLKALNQLLNDAQKARREENSLFEDSAKELNTLVDQLRRELPKEERKK